MLLRPTINILCLKAIVQSLLLLKLLNGHPVKTAARLHLLAILFQEPAHLGHQPASPDFFGGCGIV